MNPSHTPHTFAYRSELLSRSGPGPDVDLELLATGGALGANVGGPALVDLPVELLEVAEVGREQPLDHPGVDLAFLHLAELGDHAREEDDHQIRAVVLHAKV